MCMYIRVYVHTYEFVHFLQVCIHIYIYIYIDSFSSRRGLGAALAQGLPVGRSLLGQLLGRLDAGQEVHLGLGAVGLLSL